MVVVNYADLTEIEMGGEVLIYIREYIPRKYLVDHKLTSDIKDLFTELNLRKSKWLLSGSYHPLSPKSF